MDLTALINRVAIYKHKITEWYDGALAPILAQYDVLKAFAVAVIVIGTLAGITLITKFRRYIRTRLFKSIFPSQYIFRFLLRSIRKVIDLLFLALQFSLVYAGLRLMSGQIAFEYWNQVLYYLWIALANLFLITIFIQFRSAMAQNHLSLTLAISNMVFPAVKSVYLTRITKQFFILIIDVVRFIILIPILWFYLDFLQSNIPQLDAFHLTKRFGGILILITLFHFRSSVKAIYNESLSGLKRLSNYLAIDVDFNRITIITKQQVHYLFSSVFEGLLFTVSVFSVLFIIKFSLVLISIGSFSQTFQKLSDIVTYLALLYLFWKFYRWFKSTTSDQNEKITILARILKLNMSIDRNSPFNALRFEPFIKFVLNLFNYTVILLTAYLGFTIFLRVLPVTRKLSSLLLKQIAYPLTTGAQTVVAYIPNVLIICVVILAANYIMNFAKFLFKEMEEERIVINGFYSEFAMPTYKIIRILIVIFALIIVFPYLPGSQSPAFKGISVFLGVLISLGSSSIVSNIMAGIMITYMRPFKVGDRVQIADSIGDVVEKNLLVTRIKTVKNIYVAVPNSLILGTHITNFSFMNKTVPVILHTSITIGYDVSWEKVHELLISAALATPRILPAPEPFVLQKKLSDFYVEYEINAATQDVNLMPTIYSDLHTNIQKEFNKAGIEITSPHFRTLRNNV